MQKLPSVPTTRIPGEHKEEGQSKESERVEEKSRTSTPKVVERGKSCLILSQQKLPSSLSPSVAKRRVDEHKKIILLEERIEEMVNKL